MSTGIPQMEGSARRCLILKGVALSLLSIFQMGYASAYPNTAIDSFRQFIGTALGGISEEAFNWIWSAILNVYFIGFAAGSWIAVPLADRIGRKWCLVVGNSANFLSAVIAFFSVLFLLPWLFLISRIVFAMAAAISMNSLILLLQEASPPSLRGLMSFNAEMAFVVMNLVGAFAGMRSIFGTNLPLLLGLACIPTFASLLLALSFHESPKFLVLQKKDDEAASKALKFYQGLDKDGCASALNTISEEKNPQTDTRTPGLLRSPRTLFGLALGVITLQLTSSLWPLLYYSTELLRRAGISYDGAEEVSSVMLFVSSMMTVVGMIMVERLPRRALLLGSASVNVLALFLFVASEIGHHAWPELRYGCVAAVVLHGTSYSVGLGPIAWFITAELVDQNHRALCQSVALSINQLGALLLCFITLPLYNSFGSIVLLFLFAIPGCFCLLFLYKFLPETRNRSIGDIAADMPASLCGIPITSARGERIAMEDLAKTSPRDLE